MLCASCKNATSNERCRSNALQNLQFCGKHVKVKSPRLWSVVNNVPPKIILIQKIWRGFAVRNWIKNAGPGCIKRSLCHNEEELVTLEPVSKINPLDFFSFEENGKIWAFDVNNLASVTFCKLKPVNPYTRQPLTLDVRRRLRKVCKLKGINTRPTDLSGAWTSISQILEENGFEEVDPFIFESMNKTQCTVFLQLLKSDLEALSGQSPRNATRIKYVMLVKHVLKKYTPFPTNLDASRKTVGLLNILLQLPNPYPLCFAIMGALTRL